MSTGELDVQPAVRDGKSGDGSESSHEETAKPQTTEVTETPIEAASQPTTSNSNEALQPAESAASTSAEIPNTNSEPVAENGNASHTGFSASSTTSTTSTSSASSGSGEPGTATVTTETQSQPAEVKTEVAVPEEVAVESAEANKTAEAKDKPTTPTKEDERQKKEREKREEQSRKDKEAAKKQREQKEQQEREKAEQKEATTALSSTTPTSPNVTPTKSKKNKKAKKEANAVNATASTSGVATTTPSSTAPSTQPGTSTTSENAKASQANNNTSNSAPTNNTSNGFSQADILAKINASMSFYEGKIREQMQAFQVKETHVQQQLATQIFETSFKSTEKAISAFVASPALQALVSQIANRIDESCTTLFNQVIVPLVHQRIAYVFQQTVAINGRAIIDETLKENIASVVAPSLKNLFAELVTQVSRNFEIGLRFTLEQQLKHQDAVKKDQSVEEDETVAELTRLAERMTQHIIEIQNKIVHQLLDSSEFGAHGGEGRASQADPVSLTRQIESHLTREDYNAAFEVALGSQNLEILTWTLSIVNPEDVFAKNPLPQDKIIATIQQAGCSLSLSPNVKVEWLQVLLLELDESDSTNKKYGRAVLSELLESLRGLDQAMQMSGLKLLIRQVEKKLRSF